MIVSHHVLNLFSVLSLLSSVARADIVGGDDVRVDDPVRKSTVGLYSPDPSGAGGSLCTASLIGKDTAVTAAHCVPSGSGARSVLIFGRDLHSASAEKRPVTQARVNAAWARHHGQGMDQGDIAVVHFPGGLPAGYRTIGLNRSDSAIKAGEDAVLAGYGISNAKTHAGAGVLRRTTIPVADPRRGRSEMILDQSHRHGACHGDSGGPAFIDVGGKTVLAGVTNRSYPASATDDCNHQVVYTKVNAYRPWIAQSEKAMRKAASAGGLMASHKSLAARKSVAAPKPRRSAVRAVASTGAFHAGAHRAHSRHRF